MEERVVITGIGVISPIGIGKEKFWNSLISGVSGIDKITFFPLDNSFSTRIAAEVKNFNPEDYINNKKEIRKMDRFLQFSVAASGLAIKDANLEINEENCEDIGVLIGSGIGGMSMLEEQHKILLEKGPQKVSPFFIPMMIINMASGLVGINFKIKGPNLSIVTACATGAHSIGEAYEIIRNGKVKIMLTGGTEAAITPLSLAGFSSMRALSTRNESPAKACRPFDLNRDGFVMAEGAGVIILESLSSALKRKANIYAEIIGFGLSADAYHIANPEPSGDGARRAMLQALKDSKISYDRIDYINAHGTSTPVGDKTETLAIKQVFKDFAHKLSISSTKSMTGHTLGAAGALESIVCILALKNNLIPPTINYEEPDPDCDLDYTPNNAREKKINYAMNNSFGFGGQNAVLVFKKYSENQ
ncbi:MAG: beta-ketoacyl-ACP synthase II [Armatimonadetes bacterium]|nr:beta-ketoacyl-ACP synthase II [Armatimonadota bacterium]